MQLVIERVLLVQTTTDTCYLYLQYLDVVSWSVVSPVSIIVWPTEVFLPDSLMSSSAVFARSTL